MPSDERMYYLEGTSNPSNSWGPIWLIYNYFAFVSLIKAGRRDLASALCDSQISLYAKDIQRTDKVDECYHPATGEPIMGRSFSYTVSNNPVETTKYNTAGGYHEITNCVFDENTGDIEITFNAGFTHGTGTLSITAIAVAFDGKLLDEEKYTTTDSGVTFIGNYMAHPSGAYSGNSGTVLRSSGYWTSPYTPLSGKKYTLNAITDLINNNKISITFGLRVMMYYGWGWSRWDNSTYYYENLKGGTISFVLPQYDISFNLNNGSNGPSNSIKNYGTNYTIPSQTPTRENHIFLNWLGSDGNTYNPGSIYSTNANITFTAQWQQNEFTLTIDPDGGEMVQLYESSSSSNNKNTKTSFEVKFLYNNYRYLGYYPNKFYSLTNNTVGQPKNKTGYTFNGWKVTSGEGAVELYEKGLSNSPIGYKTDDFTKDKDKPTSLSYYIYNGNYQGDTTITAQWTANNYTITFDCNGGQFEDGKTSITAQGTFGSIYPRPIYDYPTRLGYEFMGWFTSDGTQINIPGGKILDIPNNHTIYAQWELQTGLVSIYTGSGTNQGWKKAIPYIYTGSGTNQGWKQAIPKIYDGSSWKDCQ